GIVDGFRAVTEVEAKPLDQLRKQKAVGVDPDADLGEVVAELTAPLLEDVRVQPPGRAEDVGESAQHVGALRPLRGFSSRAEPLANAHAGARAEDVVVTDLDETPPPHGGAVAEAEGQVPRLAFAEGDLHV